MKRTLAWSFSGSAVAAVSFAIVTLASSCGGSSSESSAGDGGGTDWTQPPDGDALGEQDAAGDTGGEGQEGSTPANDGGGAANDGGGGAANDGGGGAANDGGANAEKDGGTDAGHVADAGHDVDAGPDAAGESGLLTCSNASAVTTVDAGAAPGVVAGMVPGPGTFIAGCQIFPADNAWNVNVSSPSIVTTSSYTGIPQGTHLHPDFGGWSPDGGGTYGIPYNVVSHGQPDVSITFNQYASESDPGPGGWTTNPNGGDTGVTAYPIPNGAKIEGDPGSGQTAGDDHLLVLEQGASCGAPCALWETWDTVGGSAPPWTAANGAMWDLGSNGLRPLGWTSADAAGLSVFAGLVKFDEVAAGVVTHAIRVTFQNTQAGYVLPATHFAGLSALGGADPPMGLHLRLKGSFVTSSFSGPGQIVAQAMKTYGLVVADIGSDWYFQGDSDDRWNDYDVSDSYIGELLTDFAKVTGADFDVLDTGVPSNEGQ
jgi:hypothetical protein